MAEEHNEKSLQHKFLAQDIRLRALKKQLVYYKEITETIREPFLILNNNLEVVTANKSFYKKFKVKKNETEGKKIYDLGNSQWNSSDLRTLLENILPTKRILNNYAITLDFPRIGTRTILLNARQIDSKQLILLAMEDVTDQWKLKANIAEMTENLIEQRDKLQGLNDSKNEFISLASHQLRTPATAVKQYTGMLIHGYGGKLSKKQLAMLGVAYKNNERQLEIIEDLLRVAQVDAGKVYLDKIECNIKELISRAISNQSPLFESNKQNVIYKKPTSKMTATIDTKLILMVIESFLDNASQYSKEGGVINITIKKVGPNIIIAINDEGVGIAKKDQSKLFKKFSRIDNPMSISVKGTGLSLYWAKKVLKLHNGKIKVYSEEKKGTKFEIILPVNDSK